MMYELPPQAQGTAEQQLVALRDYLVRLAKDLDRVDSVEAVEVSAPVKEAVSKAQEATIQDIKNRAQALKALIIKNANEITEMTEARFDSLSSSYVAISDFGNYYEDIELQVQQTARETLESYHYTESIEALESYMTELNGQIRRGVIEDPETHEMHIGIAISEELSFSGTWTDPDTGTQYDQLESGQTLGLYTSTGWQFWINGQRMGWFSSGDSMLHVANITIEDALQLGANWQITTTGGFGLRYIGD